MCEGSFFVYPCIEYIWLFLCQRYIKYHDYVAERFSIALHGVSAVVESSRLPRAFFPWMPYILPNPMILNKLIRARAPMRHTSKLLLLPLRDEVRPVFLPRQMTGRVLSVQNIARLRKCVFGEVGGPTRL